MAIGIFTLQTKIIRSQDTVSIQVFSVQLIKVGAGETKRLEMISAKSQSLEIKNQLQQIKFDLNICSQKLQLLLNSDMPIYPIDTVSRKTY